MLHHLILHCSYQKYFCNTCPVANCKWSPLMVTESNNIIHNMIIMELFNPGSGADVFIELRYVLKTKDH